MPAHLPQSVQKKSGQPSFKTLDSTIQTKNKDTGKKEAITYRQVWLVVTCHHAGEYELSSLWQLPPLVTRVMSWGRSPFEGSNPCEALEGAGTVTSTGPPRSIWVGRGTCSASAVVTVCIGPRQTIWWAVAYAADGNAQHLAAESVGQCDAASVTNSLSCCLDGNSANTYGCLGFTL